MFTFVLFIGNNAFPVEPWERCLKNHAGKPLLLLLCPDELGGLGKGVGSPLHILASVNKAQL